MTNEEVQPKSITKQDVINPDQVILFPNPALDELNIIIPFTNSNMRVINTAGAVVKEQRLLPKLSDYIKKEKEVLCINMIMSILEVINKKITHHQLGAQDYLL